MDFFYFLSLGLKVAQVALYFISKGAVRAGLKWLFLKDYLNNPLNRSRSVGSFSLTYCKLLFPKFII